MATSRGKVTVENGKASEKKTNQKLYFKSNAVVFVKYKTDDYKVVTGKDVANWSKTDIARIEALGENTSGNYYVQVGVITMNTKIPGASNSNYAYALDDSYKGRPLTAPKVHLRKGLERHRGSSLQV